MNLKTRIESLERAEAGEPDFDLSDVTLSPQERYIRYIQTPGRTAGADAPPCGLTPEEAYRRYIEGADGER